MNNKDLKNLTKEEIKKMALEAINSGKPEEQVEVLEKYFENLAKEVKEEFDNAVRINDNAVLAQRGANALTSEEIKFYQKLANAIRTNQALEDIDNILPITTIDRVFEDLEQNHPLLQHINFQNVTGLTEIIVREGDCEAAWWGELTEEIKKQLKAAFKKIDVKTLKLSAYLPIAKSHADLGPQYLDLFIRRFLAESISMALEKAIITADGKNKPIGMNRNLEGAVIEGVYPEKTKIVIKNLSLYTIGDLFARLTNDGKRVVNSVIMIVNSYDYNAKVKPALYHLNANGEYVMNIPYPITFVESCAIDKGSAVIGIAKNYFFGLGSNQRIDKSDEYHFLEDETVYLSKMYGVGRPFDNTSFLYLDISALGTLDAPMADKMVVETKEVLGKQPSELLENSHIFEDGSVVATFKKVTKFTEFSNNPDEQEGYYFPLELKKEGKALTITKNGVTTRDNVPYDSSIVMRVTKDDVFEVFVDNESVAKLNFKYSTFNELEVI